MFRCILFKSHVLRLLQVSSDFSGPQDPFRIILRRSDLKFNGLEGKVQGKDDYSKELWLFRISDPYH